MTQKTYFRNPHLAGEDFFWKGNKTGILLIHGFTATTAEVRLLAEKLHASGYTTAGPLLPGHGTHPDELNNVTWHMWVEKAKQTYEALASHCEQVFIAGESLGGVLALELARQHPEAAGIFLFAPGIKVNGIWLAHILSFFIKYLKKSDEDDGLPWQGYTVNPVKGIVEVHRIQKHVQRRLAEILQPLVIFTGEYDQTISPDSAEMILEGVSSKIKHHIHMPESGHCVILDHELDQIAEQVLRFIESGFS
jgi:carboxylesterase